MSLIEIIEVLSVLITGWIAGAESASSTMVQPIIKRLEYPQQLVFRKGLISTYGFIMPIVMPISLFLIWYIYVDNANKDATLAYIQLIAAIILSAGILTTLIFNIPIDKATKKFNPELGTPEWRKIRKTWTRYHRFRSVTYMLAFILQLIGLQF